MSWYDDYCPDPFDDTEDLDDDWQPHPKTRPTCQRCGKANLIWGWTPQGWRLYEGFERPHNCGPKPATPNDFEEV